MTFISNISNSNQKIFNNSSSERKVLDINIPSKNQTSLINSHGANALRAKVLGEISFGSGKSDIVRGLFKKCAANKNHPAWELLIERIQSFRSNKKDMRHAFEIDYDRIIHSEGFTRYPHKTQVFAAPTNDHVSTRIIHVIHVARVAEQIAGILGLNQQLVRAIAMGHDLGHAPFGHQGEKELTAIMKKKNIPGSFWHEKNGLRFVDNIETLVDSKGVHRNLNLTYAIRDGIICHCGEVDQNGLRPRTNYIVNLSGFDKKDQPAPFTWEGCVMKISDKIPFIGRDVEDAIRLGAFSKEKKDKLLELANNCMGNKRKLSDINSGTLMNTLITDICKNSSPEKGIAFSKEGFELIKTVRGYNLHNIYLPENVTIAKQSDGALERIFDTLEDYHNGEKTLFDLVKARDEGKHGSTLLPAFVDFISKYSKSPERDSQFGNKPLYSIEKKEDYQQAIIDYIAGMTDRFALKAGEDIKNHNNNCHFQ